MGECLRGCQCMMRYSLAPVLLDVYDYQQQRYISENTFSLFSFVGMALLELGVIVECDDNN